MGGCYVDPELRKPTGASRLLSACNVSTCCAIHFTMTWPSQVLMTASLKLRNPKRIAMSPLVFLNLQSKTTSVYTRDQQG